MQTINRRELQQMMASGREFVLIEALSEEDFAQCHLPYAINVPLEDARFEDRVREAVPEPEYDIVVYCSNERCPVSRKAAARIEALGYVSVYRYGDGKDAWFRDGSPEVVPPGAPTVQ